MCWLAAKFEISGSTCIVWIDQGYDDINDCFIREYGSIVAIANHGSL